MSEVINLRSHSKRGLASRIHGGQKRSSRLRGYENITYSSAELFEWMEKQTNFDCLFLNWINSGYDMMKTPSCDRIDDYKPYSFTNMRIVTWRENQKKSHRDRRNGINNISKKSVAQLTLDGELIGEYISIVSASKETGITRSGINMCCLGSVSSHKGFKWEYTNSEENKRKELPTKRRYLFNHDDPVRKSYLTRTSNT